MCFPFEQRLFVWLCNSCLSVCGCGGGGVEMGAWVYGHNPKHFLVHFFLTTRSTGTQFSVLPQPLLFKPVTSICWPVIMSKACQHHTHAHSHTELYEPVSWQVSKCGQHRRDCCSRCLITSIMFCWPLLTPDKLQHICPVTPIYTPAFHFGSNVLLWSEKKKKKHPVCYSHETSYLPGMRAHLPPVSPPHPSGSTGPTTTSGPSQLAASASRPTPTAGKQIHVLSTLKNKKRASNIPWKQKYLNYTRIIWKHFDSTSMLHPWSWRDI